MFCHVGRSRLPGWSWHYKRRLWLKTMDDIVQNHLQYRCIHPLSSYRELQCFVTYFLSWLSYYSGLFCHFCPIMLTWYLSQDKHPSLPCSILMKSVSISDNVSKCPITQMNGCIMDIIHNLWSALKNEDDYCIIDQFTF